MKIFLEKCMWGSSIAVHMAEEGPGRLAVVQPIIFKEIEAEKCSSGVPAFSLLVKEAQDLMDQLWQCGLRPTEGTGSAGSLKATQNHLEDMRKIAFGVLDQMKGKANG